MQKLGFVGKVLALATVLSVLIKWGGPQLSIPATAGVSGAIVVLPSIGMGLILAWRAQRS